MIEVNLVSKWYGSVRALSDVSFEAGKGRVVGLLGPNGAGKTTTIRIVTGFLPPSGGSVRVCGHDSVDESMAARRAIGYLPDSAPLYPEMSVDGYLDYRARLFGMRRANRKPAAAKAMDRCRITDVRNRRIGELSKGYRQRVGLASALLHEPPVLVLDEPMTGLDPSQIREARSLIKELSQDRTVLLSSHILAEVEQTCDHVVIIAGGRVRAKGSPKELTESVAEGSPYIIEAQGGPGRSAADVASLVAAVTGVSRADGQSIDGAAATGNWCRVTVMPSKGAGDLRESLAGALASASVRVRELRRERATLEQLFIRVITGDGEVQR